MSTAWEHTVSSFFGAFRAIASSLLSRCPLRLTHLSVSTHPFHLVRGTDVAQRRRDTFTASLDSSDR